MDKFKKFLTVKGYSNNTINNYIYNIRQFISYLNTLYDINDISSISTYSTNTTSNHQLKNLIDDYLLKLIKENKKAETINCFIKALKLYLRFKEIDIETPKTLTPNQSLPDAISEEYFLNEIDPILPLAFEDKSLKIKTILWFMFYTGLRKGEIYCLKRKDFNLEERTVKVTQSKTKNQRVAFYPENVKNLLELYFSTELEKDNAFNIKKSSIDWIFKKLKPNFPDINLRPHLFRHSFATMLLKKGIDITVVQKLMGHKNINTTLKYLQTDTSLLKEIYDKKIK